MSCNKKRRLKDKEIENIAEHLSEVSSGSDIEDPFANDSEEDPSYSEPSEYSSDDSCTNENRQKKRKFQRPVDIEVPISLFPNFFLFYFTFISGSHSPRFRR